MIPFLDLKAINSEYKSDLIEAFESILKSGWFIGGHELKSFEEEFSNYCGTKYCIGVEWSRCLIYNIKGLERAWQN